VALVAVSRGRLVGVDIEKLDAAGPMARRDAVLHPDERARDTEELTTTWVRKESLLKATGDGLRVDPAEIRLSDPDEEPRLLEWAGDRVLAATWMADLRIDGFTACVTVLADRIDLSSRPAAPAALSR
jgi:4'-phosphopantetheinyl transferase